MDVLKTQSEIFLNDNPPQFKPNLPNTTENYSLKLPRHPIKPVPTKIMMQDAIKALSTQSRKGFSLVKIRKYVLQKYLHTANEVKYRLPHMKKFFKSALENGDVVSVKGAGLTGSFRVPPTSLLHKNAKQSIRKSQKEQTGEDLKKKRKNEKATVAKKEKVNVNRRFSANM